MIVIIILTFIAIPACLILTCIFISVTIRYREKHIKKALERSPESNAFTDEKCKNFSIGINFDSPKKHYQYERKKTIKPKDSITRKSNSKKKRIPGVMMGGIQILILKKVNEFSFGGDRSEEIHNRKSIQVKPFGGLNITKKLENSNGKNVVEKPKSPSKFRKARTNSTHLIGWIAKLKRKRNLRIKFSY